MKKQVNNKLASARKQVIGILSLASISLLLMIIDICIEIYYYSQNKGATDFPQGFITTHVAFATIELLSAITILTLTSTSYCIFNKQDKLCKVKNSLFIANWVFSGLYIILSVVAIALLWIEHTNYVQAFLAGLSVLPFVGIVTISAIIIRQK